jgi:tape measure domain-containing protein
MTQSGGQAAGIQLQVGLDLAFFRNQLTGLQAVAAGTKLSFGVAFNRLDIQNQLNALATNIKKRNYFLEVKTNLTTEIKNAGTLAKALRGLDNAVQKNKGIASRTAGGAAGAIIDASKIQSLVNKATKPALEALYSEMSKVKIPMADVGKGTVKELRESIISGVPGITQDIAKGLANGLNPELKENGTKGAKIFIDAFKTATGIASPSKVFKALGKFSAGGLEIGFLNGLKDFKRKSLAEIKSIVALLQFELAKVSNVAMSPGMSRSSGGQRSREYMSPIGPLAEGSKEPWAFSQYRHQPFMAQPGQTRGAGVPPMKERFPFASAPSVMGTIASPGMLGASFPALPAAGMTGGSVAREVQRQSRVAAAYARSAAREASVLGESQMYATVAGQVPLGGTARRLPPGNKGGALALRDSVGGGSGGDVMGGITSFANALGNINLPGAGVVREIGSEFAMAAKQVLLLGTAYKALAFATSFPAQVGEAVGALQSFNNTLKAISPSAQEASASNQFILDIVDRYNVPLQSARDGFTKLYASMAPAGFKGDEIRALFTGVSQAAATFGMSADKVDRVNYAFAQMASKGQVMSEELKGQLGDVLPGAMGIFAEAAGFKGPQAIEKFSKALEDGAYKGDAMRGLLRNVTTVLTKEFGPGAEGAARTFQGVINRMQNSTKLLYEAFEPVAVGFLNSVVVPLTSGIKTVSDGFTAFFTGVNAKTSGGFAIAQELEKLKPTFEGIRSNVTALLPTLQSFASTLLGLGKVFLQIAGNPFIGYLTRVYLSVLPLTIAIRALNLQALIPLIASFLRAIPAFIAFTAATVKGATANKALQLSMQLTGQTAGVTAAQIRTVSVALKAAFASTVVLAIVAGIGMIIEKMISLGARMDEVRKKAMGTAESIRSMSQAEARQAGNQAASDVRLIQGISQRQQLAGRPGRIAVTAQEQAALERAGVTTQSTATRGRGAAGFTQSVELTQLRGAIDKRQGDFREAEYRQRVEKFNAQQQALPASLPSIASPEAENQQEKDRKVKDASRLNQLIQEQLEAQNRLGLIGKDELSQIEAKAQLAKEILALTLKDIRLTETGVIQAQSITNATLAYQVTVAELNKEWDDVIKKIADVEKEGRDLYKTILQQKNVEQSPLQKELADIQDQAQNSIDKIDELLNSLTGRAGTRLEGSQARQALGNLKASLQGRTPEQERLLASQKLTKPVKEDLEGQLQSLLNSGKTLTTLDQIILKVGDDWRALSPQVQDDLAQLAGKVDAAKPFAEIASAIRESREELTRMTSTSTLIVSSANSISDAFGTAFKGVITGSMSAREALAGFFQSLADSFADMVAKMIAEYLKMQLIQGIMSLIPGLGSFGGGAAVGQAVSMPTGVGIGAGGGILQNSGAQGFGTLGPNFGIRQFANGGIVTGPTLGLVGEGRYNEAVIPLPDGKSVPVDLGGAMGNQITSNIVVNVSSDGKTSSSGAGSDSAGLGRKIEGAVKQVIVGELRPGGLLAGMR